MKTKREPLPSTPDTDALKETLSNMQPPMSHPPEGNDRINKRLLLIAWDGMTSVMRDLVNSFEKAQEQDKKTRRDNQITREHIQSRTVIIVTTIMISMSFALFASAWFAKRMYSIELIAVEAKRKLTEARRETKSNSILLHETLRLLRQQSKVQGLQLEESTESTVVLREAVQLQAKALQAEVQAAKISGMPVPEDSKAEMRRVKNKAKQLNIDLK